MQKPNLTNDVDEASLREKFIKKQKEYLELQQKKLELELLQTRTQIEMRKKRNMLKVNIFITFKIVKKIYMYVYYRILPMRVLHLLVQMMKLKFKHYLKIPPKSPVCHSLVQNRLPCQSKL